MNQNKAFLPKGREGKERRIYVLYVWVVYVHVSVTLHSLVYIQEPKEDIRCPLLHFDLLPTIQGLSH